MGSSQSPHSVHVLLSSSPTPCSAPREVQDFFLPHHRHPETRGVVCERPSSRSSGPGSQPAGQEGTEVRGSQALPQCSSIWAIAP